ncbi:hypothetical protein JZO83_03915 [Enterococcus sp. DIV1298c]|uniref:hypothetical protein n=1 Tax=Enterococcus sp. DIV1298c TaxID=2815328 RepID=UPI001A90D00E|nr:hypothetical protein [Enterococcus sp. DIV1298c]MBO0460886.1 hypothetical protein [Enterococcus sp. DIV1298c]
MRKKMTIDITAPIKELNITKPFDLAIFNQFILHKRTKELLHILKKMKHQLVEDSWAYDKHFRWVSTEAHFEHYQNCLIWAEKLDRVIYQRLTERQKNHSPLAILSLMITHRYIHEYARYTVKDQRMIFQEIHKSPQAENQDVFMFEKLKEGVSSAITGRRTSIVKERKNNDRTQAF